MNSVEPLATEVMARIDELAAISEKKGARTSVHLATSDSVAGVNGKYFDKCKAAQSSAQSHDEQARERLWRISEELTDFSY